MAVTAVQDGCLPQYLHDIITSQREETLGSQAGPGIQAEGEPPSITLDLGSRGITSLPEEFFELVKGELERSERMPVNLQAASTLMPTVQECRDVMLNK